MMTDVVVTRPRLTSLSACVVFDEGSGESVHTRYIQSCTETLTDRYLLTHADRTACEYDERVRVVSHLTTRSHINHIA